MCTEPGSVARHWVGSAAVLYAAAGSGQMYLIARFYKDPGKIWV